MLKFDQLLLQETKGQIGETLENAIKSLSTQQYKVNPLVFGEVISLDDILVTERNAKNRILSNIQQYWGNVDLFTHHFFRDTHLDIETINSKLHSFLSSSQGKQVIFDYLLIHHTLSFKNLIGIIFEKDIEVSNPVGGLSHFYLYKVNKRYFIHVVYRQQLKFWNTLFLKKVYSIFMQVELGQIQSVVALMKQFHTQLRKNYTQSQSVAITNRLIEHIDLHNTRSYLLKELHIFNIGIHFNGGKRHFNKIRKMVPEVIESWRNGHWIITDKEQTLLTYMLIIDTYQSNEIKKTIEHGQQLVKKERLHDHAIELLLEYSDVLPSLKPEPTTLVKQYDKNFLEQTFYILIDALVKNERFEVVISLLKNYEIASCQAIYHYLNSKPLNNDLLHQIEATVQRDIAMIVDQSLHHVSESIETWLIQYKQADDYIHLSQMTSKHVCNLLKSLFATHHYDLFERLMEIYNKYLVFDDHFENLKEFVSTSLKKG